GVVLPDWEQAALHDSTPDLHGHRGLIHPPLLTRRETVEEGSAPMVEPLPSLVHNVYRVSHRRRGDIAVWMPFGHHLCEVLGRELLRGRIGLSVRCERSHAGVRRRRRRLDSCVRVALVVVANEESIVVAVQGPRD